MSTEHYIPEAALTMTQGAIEHAAKQLAKAKAQALRISLVASGCSGFKYSAELAKEKFDEDEVITVDSSVKLFVNRNDLAHLKGTEIDYVTQGVNKQLVFKNPNITGECGCGESISFS